MSNPSDNYQYSIDSSSLFDNDSSSQYETTNVGTEYVSADQFGISNTEAQKLNTLADAKQKKLDRLSQKNQNASLDDSFTELEDGRLESNRNKIWNDLSGQEYQDLFNYGVSNYALKRDEEGNLVYSSGERYSGPTRRLYMFGTQTDSDEQIKLGLARGDLEGSEARYQPDINTGYGWAPGGLGVDTSKKELDVLLPYNVATMLEGLGHGRKQALEGRVVKDRYEDPFLAEKYGSGSSEYYTSRDALFGAPTEYDEAKGQELFNQYIQEMQQRFPDRGVVDQEAYDAQQLKSLRRFEVKKAGIGGRLANTLAGAASTFASELLIKPADALGELTGIYDIDDSASEEFGNFLGYNPEASAMAMEKIGTQWDKLVDENATITEKGKAALNGILEAFINPELFGTSIGALAAWVVPGSLLTKGLGVGSKFTKTANRIDKLQEAGKLSSAAARAKKAKAFMSIDGAKKALASQAGFLVSAAGNVNEQYKEFVENNNGVELPPGEKASWFASRFAIQILNQNLDKIIDFNVMKNPGLITAILPAVKDMTNKEFAKVAKAMGKGVLKTAENMGKEAVQEYAQTMMELFNSRYGSKQFSDVETFTDFITDERNTREAGIAALAGAGGAPQFETLGLVTGVAGKGLGLTAKGVSKAAEAVKTSPTTDTPTQAEVEAFTPTVDEEVKVTEDQIQTTNAEADKKAGSVVGKYAAMVDDNELAGLLVASTEDEALVDTPTLDKNLAETKQSYADIVSEIEEAEAIIQSRQGTERQTESDEVAFKLLRKAKRQAAKNIIEGGQDIPTLGSGYTPEDVVGDYLEATEVANGQLVLTAEESAALDKYVEDNEIPAFRFEQLRAFRTGEKDASQVQEDIYGKDERSAVSQRNNLKTLVNTPGVSKKLVAEAIGQIDYFLNSQQNRKTAFDSVLNEVKADVAKFNDSVKDPTKLTIAQRAEKRRIKNGRNIPGYTGAFVSVSENPNTGKLVVSPASVAISKSIEDNINYIERTKAIYGSKINNILGQEYNVNDRGITVRPNPARQEARGRDLKFYTNNNVTKAIVDENKSSTVWKKGNDYAVDNATKINTSKYSEDDVVVVNSKSTSFAKGSNVRKELAAAYKAGATIIVDNASAGNQKLRNLIKNYHFTEVKEDGNVIRYMPKAKAEPIIAKQKEKQEEIKVNKARKRQLVADIESENREGINSALELFGGDRNKLRNFYGNLVKNQGTKFTENLMQLALTKGFNSVELSDKMVELIEKGKKGEVSKRAVSGAIKVIETQVAELEKGEKILASWNQAQEEAKKGNLNFRKWAKENIENPQGIAKAMLENAVGKGKRDAFVYYDEAKNTFSAVSTNKQIIPKDTPFQTLVLDPTKYVQVSNITAFNSLSPDQLKAAGLDNIAFNQLIATAKEQLEEVIAKPVVKQQGTNRNSILSFTNSPASSLIFNADLEVNENVAIAMKTALYTYIKNNAYLLNKNRKSKKDLAELLGIDETQLSKEAYEMLKDKGVMYKTITNSIGKDIASLMGLSRKSDQKVDAQAYDALIADLGQIAVLMGQAEGLFEYDNSIKSEKFAEVVLQKDKKSITRGEGANVIFINVPAKSEKKVKEVAEEAVKINETIPGSDPSRREPSLRPLSEKEINKKISKIRKEMLGLAIPKESQDALKELMNTEWIADLELIRETLEFKEEIKTRLGYVEIDSPEYGLLSYEEKQTQESVNRGIDKELDELELLTKRHKGKKRSMWFSYFFSKNGRFFIDSNTINVQSYKHLHRFMVQPKSHLNKFTKAKLGQFKIGNKDVTQNVYYAIAQGLGFATDKKDTAKIKDFAEKIIKTLNTKEKISEARKAFLEGSDYQDLGIKMEHLGHALQTFKFLELMLEGKPFTSPITAEFDAVTSGFGLKNLQMPIISRRVDWLKKVGIIFNDDEVLTDEQVVSMNDILDSGEVKDSYQTLATDVSVPSFEGVLENLPKNSKVNNDKYTENVWEKLSEVLPKKSIDGAISGALRNLFKYPFMTFNYSASISSIKKNLLRGELITSLAKDMAKADLSDKESPVVQLMEALNKDTKSLQEDIRSKPMERVKVGEKLLEALLGDMIEASYGTQVEQILENNFEPFVAAQDKINDSFKAMFEIFAVSFEKELTEARKKGKVSIEDEKEIYNKLKAQWPMIKGPLSNMESELVEGDGIGIYDSQTASPYGIYGGRKPVRANLTKAAQEALGGQKDVRVSHMIKQMATAIAAGSVVPIHYVDGAVMAQTINTLATQNIKGITSIHDAIMPSLTNMAEAQQAYNKQTVDVNLNYSFINEILNSLDRFLDTVPLNDPSYARRKVKVGKGKEVEEVPARDFLLSARNNLATLVNDVNVGRGELFNKLNQGAKIMHMAGSPEGVYSIEPDTLEYKPIEKVLPRKYNSTIKIDGKTVDDLAKAKICR